MPTTGGTRNNCPASHETAAEYKVSTTKRASFGTLRTAREGTGLAEQCVWSLELDADVARVGAAEAGGGPGDVASYFDGTGSGDPTPIASTSAGVPSTLRESQFAEKTGWATYDGINSPPAALSGAAGSCAATPGPASATNDALYCVQTRSPSWVGYKWYKFVDRELVHRMPRG